MRNLRTRIDRIAASLANRTIKTTSYAAYRNDPVGYAERVLGVSLWAKQRELLELTQRPPYRILVRAGHKVGKSFVGACAASWHYDCFDPGITYITAPTQNSVKDILFKELRTVRKSNVGFLPKATRLESSAAHWCHGYVARSGEGFQGRHSEHLMMIFDEAVGIESVFFDVGRSMFRNCLGHSWICFYNPTDISSQVYQEEQSGDWHIVEMSQFDHPNIQAELRGEDPPYPSAVSLAQTISQMDTYGERIPLDREPVDGEVSLCLDGEPKYRWIPGPNANSRVLARWPTQGGASIWSERLWDRMSAVAYDIDPRWKVTIGCDIARFGDDDTVIVVKKGPCILSIESHNGWGLDRTLTRLQALAWEHKGDISERQVLIQIDGGGNLGGLADFAPGWNIVPILGIAVASDQLQYYNTRTELWFHARSHAEADLIDISRIDDASRRRLRAELLAPTYEYDPRNRYVVEAKQLTKNKIKRSPDVADAFNLACYLSGFRA